MFNCFSIKTNSKDTNYQNRLEIPLNLFNNFEIRLRNEIIKRAEKSEKAYLKYLQRLKKNLLLHHQFTLNCSRFIFIKAPC